MGSPNLHSSTSRSLIRLGVLLVILVGAWWMRPGDRGESGPSTGGTPEPNSPSVQSSLGIEQLFEREQSNTVVESMGRVTRILPDDNEGSRHQRFIVALESGHTVLLSHNIDLAPRVPLDPGDQLEFRGEYEWNARGGVVHWTHHDPGRRRPGGWIRHQGKIYK